MHKLRHRDWRVFFSDKNVKARRKIYHLLDKFKSRGIERNRKLFLKFVGINIKKRRNMEEQNQILFYEFVERHDP